MPCMTKMWMNKINKYPLIAISRLRMNTDGKGVTTLVAGSGCPLSCAYCINRDILTKPPTMVTPEELYNKVKTDDLYFTATGGGIAFGGGEALLHTEFVRDFRSICGDKWKLTAETSLNIHTDLVRLASEVFDEFIVDIKTLNPDIYKAYTGADGALAYSNLQLLASLADPSRIKVRVPLIPKYNTSDDQNTTVSALKKIGIGNFDLFTYVTR